MENLQSYDPAKLPIHISLDTETLALGPRGLIFDIGAVGCFGERHEAFNYSVNPLGLLDSSQEGIGIPFAGLFNVNQDTLRWHKTVQQANWLKYLGLPLGDTATEHFMMCQNFQGWITDLKLKYQKRPLWLWCQGINFDITKIEHHFDMYGLSIPWDYKAPQDLRTSMKLLNIPKDRDSTAHTALADAQAQSKTIEKILKLTADNFGVVLYDRDRFEETSDSSSSSRETNQESRAI